MRRLTALALVALGGCASLGAPPGGPERATPPVLETVTPDSGAVNVRAKSVVFTFDEVVSDRGGQSGALDNLFLISPREGTPRVTWRRNRIEVRPRKGFRPNTAYSVTLLPGLSDLRGKTMTSGRTIVFSTGATIPVFAIHGRVFDWMGERVAPNAYIEVIRRPDSLPYVGSADSTGQFAIGPLDEGTYTVRALIDNNKNRAVDPDESWDSVSVVLKGSSPFLELLAAQRDTTAPRLLTVSVQDSLSLLASFDRPLDPAIQISASSFRVVGSDSTALRIIRVRSRAAADAARRAEQDSAAARRDSTTQADSARPPRESIRLPSTTPLTHIKPSRPAPLRDFVISLDSLTPLRVGGTYRVIGPTTRGLLSGGAARFSERTITVPADTSRTPTTRPPVTRPPVRRP